MSKVSFENKTGYILKITHGEDEYKVLCGERIFINTNSESPKMIRVSMDVENFDKVMRASIKSVTLTLDRAIEFCYLTRFDMCFCDADIISRKVEIKQVLRRYEFDVVFLLLQLDIDIPVEYKFLNKLQKTKIKAFTVLKASTVWAYCFLAVLAGVMALLDGFSAVNIFFMLLGVGGIAFFIRDVIRRHKVLNFEKYYKDIILFESIPCLPAKFKKRTIEFSDDE